jgi:hypothetical protein
MLHDMGKRGRLKRERWLLGSWAMKEEQLMKHAAFLLASACLCGAPVLAGDLLPRYAVIGTVSATISTDVYDMVIVQDMEKDRAMAERKLIMGSFLTINTVGMVVNEAGEPDSPVLQVTLQEQGGKMALLSAELFDDQGYDAPLVMGPDGGEGSLTDYRLDGDEMRATVSGSFLRLTNYMSEPQPAEGAAPLAGTIHVAVTLPPLED